VESRAGPALRADPTDVAGKRCCWRVLANPPGRSRVPDFADQVNLAPFYRAHRDDGHGHPAYDPKTLLGVLLYAYAIGVRSSRQIERRCAEDVAFRVLAGNQTPDHVTIARFRVRHEQALAGFLVESLRLCAAAGVVRVGVVALDGTKVAANGADRANCTVGSSGQRAIRLGRSGVGRLRGPADQPPATARTSSVARPRKKPAISPHRVTSQERRRPTGRISPMTYSSAPAASARQPTNR